MSITSSERPFNMDTWVFEKSDKVLSSACRLVDLLKEMDDKLPSDRRKHLTSYLADIVYNATKLSLFGHEKLGSFDDKWVKRMMTQGSQGFQNYQRHTPRRARRTQVRPGATEGNPQQNGYQAKA